MAKDEKLNIPDLSSGIISSLMKDFQDPEVREVYSEEFINMKIATQIKVLREQRGWKQTELAERSQMKQPRVAVLENVNYESWSLATLRQFARAYDLVVDVEFKEYGEFLKDFNTFGRKPLEKRSFKDDPVFKKSSKRTEHELLASASRRNVVKRSTANLTKPFETNTGVPLGVLTPQDQGGQLQFHFGGEKVLELVTDAGAKRSRIADTASKVVESEPESTYYLFHKKAG